MTKTVSCRKTRVIIMKFDSYHPAVNLIYFTAVVLFTVCFNHPVYVILSYLAAFAYSVKLNGRRAFVFNLCLVPLMFVYAGFYAYYNHFGVTVLRQNFIGNSITVESLAYGLMLGFSIAAVLMWASCIFAVFSADKVVYLFGKISPKLSLFLSIIFRSVPRIKQSARRINTSQQGVGRGIGNGNVLRKMVNVLRLISILITWTLENFVESARSMKCRGYSLRGRTAFSIYRFDNRDRSIVLAIFVCLTFIASAVMFDQTFIYYDPEIVMNRITAMSVVFYLVYAVLLLMPMVLQIAGEKRFGRLIKNMNADIDMDMTADA